MTKEHWLYKDMRQKVEAFIDTTIKLKEATITTAQLITELEKRGVLTFGEGDKIVHEGETYLVTGTTADYVYLTVIMDGKFSNVCRMDCTHSADDPRLLGRVLRGLVKGRYHIAVNYDFKVFNKVSVTGPFSDSIELHLTAWVADEKHYEGDTLLEAALKALLAKVEGEN